MLDEEEEEVAYTLESGAEELAEYVGKHIRRARHIGVTQVGEAYPPSSDEEGDG